METAFALSEDVHLCDLNDAIVVLDAKLNKYSLFVDEQVTWISEILNPAFDGQISDKAKQFAMRLQRYGLIGPSVSTGPPVAKGVSVPRPTACVHGPLANPSLFASIRLVPFFLSALHYARGLVDRADFYSTLQSLRQSKPASRSPFVNSNNDAARVAQTFTLLAPYFVTLKDACLLRSIALFRLLHLCGLLGTLNFGVRLSPFTAHCWVESDGVVLNDELDDVLEFTKIMVV